MAEVSLEVNVSLAVLAATKMRECLNIGLMPTHMVLIMRKHVKYPHREVTDYADQSPIYLLLLHPMYSTILLLNAV